MATSFEYNNAYSVLNNMLGRGKSAPLDNSSVFANLADFEYYLSKGTYSSATPSSAVTNENFKLTPYVGQIVSVIIGEEVKVFKITDLEGNNGKGSYSEVGTKPADASDSVKGATLLSDATDSNSDAATGVTAATPKAVKTASDNIINGTTQVLKFKLKDETTNAEAYLIYDATEGTMKLEPIVSQ